MDLTEAQRQTLEGITPMGLFIDKGEPCGCGPDAYTTRKEPAYSDSMIYHHRCGDCRNKFTTYTEG